MALAASAGLAMAGGAASASAVSARSQGSVVTPFNCSAVTPLGTLSGSGTASFSGTTPAHARVGGTVVMSGFQATLTIPGSVLDQLYQAGVHSLTAGVSAFDISATDATDPTVNVVNKLVKVGHLTLKASDNATLTIDIPRKAATVGSWVASQAGTMTFTPGSATVEFKAKAGSLSAQCTPTAPTAISTTTVS
jgi:hypothetical protein